MDFNNNGTINYSEFLAATVDKKIALTRANLQFAFHHFDTDSEGYITKHDLKEVFRRQGQKLRDEQLDAIIKQAKEIMEEEEKAMESGSGSNEERQVEEQKGLHSEEGDGS